MKEYYLREIREYNQITLQNCCFGHHINKVIYIYFSNGNNNLIVNCKYNVHKCKLQYGPHKSNFEINERISDIYQNVNEYPENKYKCTQFLYKPNKIYLHINNSKYIDKYNGVLHVVVNNQLIDLIDYQIDHLYLGIPSHRKIFFNFKKIKNYYLEFTPTIYFYNHIDEKYKVIIKTILSISTRSNFEISKGNKPICWLPIELWLYIMKMIKWFE